jgi:hypothetical protein
MIVWLKHLFSRDRRVAKTIKAECDTLRRWSERASAKNF